MIIIGLILITRWKLWIDQLSTSIKGINLYVEVDYMFIDLINFLQFCILETF